MYDETDTILSVMLTTYDNPYNPFTQWDDWYKWDTDNHYYTPELLDRYINDEDAMDDIERAQLEARAINTIIDNGPLHNVWTVVKRNTSTPIRLPT